MNLGGIRVISHNLGGISVIRHNLGGTLVIFRFLNVSNPDMYVLEEATYGC